MAVVYVNAKYISIFQVTGIYPLYRSKLKQPWFSSSASESTDTGLLYLPLLSPAPRKIESTPITPSFSVEKEALVALEAPSQGCL